jgi:hypothetical protein
MQDICDYQIEGKKLKKLIAEIEDPQHLKHFKNNLVGIIQLYLDGVIRSSSPDSLRSINQLFRILCTTVNKYYTFNSVNLESLVASIKPYFDNVQKFGSRKRAEDPHLSGVFEVYLHEYFNHLDILLDMQIDTIAPIANGAIEAGAITALKYPEAKLLPLRYSRSKRDKRVKVPKHLNQRELLQDKSVLIVEDISEEGRSILQVANHIKGYSPKLIYAIIIYQCRTHPFLDEKFSLLHIIKPTRMYELHL